MEIKKFTVNMLQENCYVVSDETRECVIIDCGAYYQEEKDAITEYVRENNLQPIHLLATHGHMDHNFGNSAMEAAYGLKPEVAADDAAMVADLAEQSSQLLHVNLDVASVPAGHLLSEHEEIVFGRHRLKVLETPGHSSGSVCFYCAEEKVLFSGDTLFQNSIGRTDLEGGSMMQMIQSLRFLAQLPDDTSVFPGHGPQTTIGNELAHNPYMDR